ncbi:MAG: hypothetical protein A2622_12700 [Bdellovibrionales bacterium RIFCSPHIGHO2_01_FULL_40_29]|nr:MAG: hypothetical protein A2622_12700 [Bdellovibrionales bacterium RIFCSPHIGHO2_01_FULL_40_29]OFZ33446.1 MAG: hypothetical protein A3D17_14185 [Bdellovibrionales bacterium RIFCSPHIGHO2_02_FULL_40_15]
MNFKNYIKVGSLVTTIGLAITACAPTQSTSEVTAAFKMTSSTSAATVATNSSLWSIFLNKASAYVPTSLQDSSGAPITLTQAWTVVKEIQFKSAETEGAEDSEIEVEFTGPYVVDLLSNTPLTIDTQLIAEKEIRRIKMKLHKVEILPDGSPAELLNNSIFIQGTIGGNNFTILMDDSTEIQIGGPNGFQPSENSQLLVEIQLANVFKQINMSTVTNNESITSASRHSGTNLCASIDSSANDIYTCIRKGLEKHANFGKDIDGDNHLSTNDSSVE